MVSEALSLCEDRRTLAWDIVLKTRSYVTYGSFVAFYFCAGAIVLFSWCTCSLLILLIVGTFAMNVILKYSFDAWSLSISAQFWISLSRPNTIYLWVAERLFSLLSLFQLKAESSNIFQWLDAQVAWWDLPRLIFVISRVPFALQQQLWVSPNLTIAQNILNSGEQPCGWIARLQLSLGAKRMPSYFRLMCYCCRVVKWWLRHSQFEFSQSFECIPHKSDKFSLQ